ncbi:hypothetical protein [Rhodopseudomonas sp. AAP120]|uniref:hypothetical protein n=1 Tax=Rhodopseudomonas sp. AAP120 TaxID=1523430 RepID=UPI000AD6BFD9|nr:hypothetical protein [Rhodopseudomonas sp. AAP120]
MTRVIEHEESFEVPAAPGREAKYLYFDDHPARRRMSGRMTRKQAEQAARAYAGKSDT